MIPTIVALYTNTCLLDLEWKLTYVGSATSYVDATMAIPLYQCARF